MSKPLEVVDIQSYPTGFYIVTSPGHLLELLPDGTVSVPMSAAEQIDSFGQLDPGWDYGGGTVVEESTIDAAHTWNRLLTMIGLETSASPGSEGEIAIAGSYGQFHLEVIVESDQSTSVAYDVRGAQEYYHLRRPTIEVLGSVLNMAGEIWSASTWSTPRSTTPLHTIGPGSHFVTTGDPFQYLQPGVSINSAYPHANTYVNTGGHMNTSAANPPSFGGLIPMTSPTGGPSSSMVPKKNAISSFKG
jgi:hypothetical protein